MIIALLVPSALAAAAAAVLAFWLGWGIWASILIYSLGGSLTLLLLAVLVARLLTPDDGDEREDG